MGDHEIRKVCDCYGHRDCPHGPVDRVGDSWAKGDESSSENVSRITREEAKQLAYLASQCSDWETGHDGFETLDKMFPEWAPFKHALCTPCEVCGDPIRYGPGKCNKCRPPQPGNGFNLVQVFETLYPWYVEQLHEELNRPYILGQYLDKGGQHGHYYTDYKVPIRRKEKS